MTSFYHPDHVIGDVFIRVQAEKDLKSLQPSISDTQEAHVTKLAFSLPKFGNTVIPNQMLTRNPRVWQAHLERISDFLLAGGGFGGEHVRMVTLNFLMQREIQRLFLKDRNYTISALATSKQRRITYEIAGKCVWKEKWRCQLMWVKFNLKMLKATWFS